MKLVLRILKFVPSIIIFACSWYLSSQETIEQMPQFFGADKIVHFVCFAGLTFWVAFGCGKLKNSRISFFLPIIIVSLYGIIDEFHQSWTPGRSCSVFDWMADTIGSFLGSIIFFGVYKLYEKHQNKLHST